MTKMTNVKHRVSRGFFIVLVAVAGAGGVGLLAQWREAVALRTELDLARMEAGELEVERLKEANARLKAAQISAAELEALRADHAALPRLRAEIEALKKAQGAGATGGK